MKEFEVTYSHTIDFVSWTCPKCGFLNQVTADMIDNGECEECGFQIPDYYSRMNECDGETDTYFYDDEEEIENEE